MDLGIANESLRRWVLQADIDHGDAPGLTTDERAELVRLRRENRTLADEREILKKAAAFFARETERDPRDGVPVRRAGEGHLSRWPRCAGCSVSPPAATRPGGAAAVGREPARTPS